MADEDEDAQPEDEDVQPEDEDAQPDDEEVQPAADEQDVKDLRKRYLIISAGVLLVVLCLLVALIVKAPVWLAIIAVLVGAAVAFVLYRFAMAEAQRS